MGCIVHVETRISLRRGIKPPLQTMQCGVGQHLAQHAQPLALERADKYPMAPSP